jgi:ribosomal protein L40E
MTKYLIASMVLVAIVHENMASENKALVGLVFLGLGLVLVVRLLYVASEPCVQCGHRGFRPKHERVDGHHDLRFADRRYVCRYCGTTQPPGHLG